LGYHPYNYDYMTDILAMMATVFLHADEDVGDHAKIVQ
jgi:hypothetical protein